MESILIGLRCSRRGCLCTTHAMSMCFDEYINGAASTLGPWGARVCKLGLNRTGGRQSLMLRCYPCRLLQGIRQGLIADEAHADRGHAAGAGFQRRSSEGERFTGTLQRSHPASAPLSFHCSGLGSREACVVQLWLDAGWDHCRSPTSADRAVRSGRLTEMHRASAIIRRSIRGQ